MEENAVTPTSPAIPRVSIPADVFSMLAMYSTSSRIIANALHRSSFEKIVSRQKEFETLVMELSMAVDVIYEILYAVVEEMPKYENPKPH